MIRSVASDASASAQELAASTPCWKIPLMENLENPPMMTPKWCTDFKKKKQIRNHKLSHHNYLEMLQKARVEYLQRKMRDFASTDATRIKYRHFTGTWQSAEAKACRFCASA